MAEKFFTRQQSFMLRSVSDGGDSDGPEEMGVEHIREVITFQVEMHQDTEVAAMAYFSETSHYIYVTP